MIFNRLLKVLGTEVVKLFGQQFGARLLEFELGRWKGPVESGYGVHLVLVRE